MKKAYVVSVYKNILRFLLTKTSIPYPELSARNLSFYKPTDQTIVHTTGSWRK